MKKIDIIKELKLIAIMTGFVLLFMIISNVIVMVLPAREAVSFELSNDSIKYVKGEGVIVSGDDTVKLYRNESGKNIELPLEEYIAGVVAAEMQANFDSEAIKAQAVAARTYYFSKRLSNCKNAKDGGEICDTTHCQVYMSKEDRMSKWKESEAEDNWNKILQAVDETKGEILIYDDEIVKYPQFFSTSWGKTEDSIEVFSSNIPYLKSTDSPGEEISKKYKETVEIKSEEFIKSINTKYKNAKLSRSNITSSVKVLSNTAGGAVKELQIGDEKISGVDFRKLFNLNSSNFSIEFSNATVSITCLGYGHGVGMSQWGANVMAKDGKKYDEILKHYYTGVEIEKIKYK